MDQQLNMELLDEIIPRFQVRDTEFQVWMEEREKRTPSNTFR